jgi:hypothetical protein
LQGSQQQKEPWFPFFAFNSHFRIASALWNYSVHPTPFHQWGKQFLMEDSKLLLRGGNASPAWRDHRSKKIWNDRVASAVSGNINDSLP